MFLQRLVYYSENKIKELGLPLVKEIKQIYASGQRNNAPAGLTGALVFNEQIFVGVIEGDRRRLSSALHRIARDKRNANLTVMEFATINERMFQDWPVIYAGHSEEIDRVYMKYGIAVGLDPMRMSAGQIVPLVAALVRINALAAPRDPGVPGSRDATTDQNEVIKVSNVFAGFAAGSSA